MDINQVSSLSDVALAVLSIVTTLGAGISWAAMWWAKGNFARTSKVDELETKLDKGLSDLNTDLALLQETVRHQPTLSDIKMLSDSIANVARDVSRISGYLMAKQEKQL